MVRLVSKAWRTFLWFCHQQNKIRNHTKDSIETHVKLDAIAIHRYILTLHRNARDNNERLILHTSLSSVIKAHNIDHSPYHTMAYTECSVSFASHKGKVTILDHNYFQPSHLYRIPIGFHPFFTPPHSVNISHKKSGSIIFLGSLEPMYDLFDSSFWNMPTRLETMKLIHNSHPELKLESPFVPNYKSILYDTEYFICLPGVHMPLCHNLYESMSCGCIPLVHVNYAKWLGPELQSLLKPVTYNDDGELLEWIPRIKTGDFLHQPNELAIKLVDHCKDALSWKTIKSSLRNSERVLVCAEDESVKLAMKTQLTP